MSKRSFAKSRDGLIHLIAAIHGEYTLCGNAFEGEDDDDPGQWVECSGKQVVTCENCILEIRNCAGVKYASPESAGGFT